MLTFEILLAKALLGSLILARVLFPYEKPTLNPLYWVPSLSAGGDNRDRTDDPLLAKQVLSQLSYTPVFITF